MTREELIEQIVEARLVDRLYVPKDQEEMEKLANRSRTANLGHAILRGAAAVPLAPIGPVYNVLRYYSKVDRAKLGIHRGNQASFMKKKRKS